MRLTAWHSQKKSKAAGFSTYVGNMRTHRAIVVFLRPPILRSVPLRELLKVSFQILLAVGISRRIYVSSYSLDGTIRPRYGEFSAALKP